MQMPHFETSHPPVNGKDGNSLPSRPIESIRIRNRDGPKIEAIDSAEPGTVVSIPVHFGLPRQRTDFLSTLSSPHLGETTMAKKEPSKAYLRFEGVIRRSLTMLRLQKAVAKVQEEKRPNSPIDLSDMSRASVVLAVAAMDSYFTDVFCERLVRFLKTKGATKELAKFLVDAGYTPEFSLRLLVEKAPFRKIRQIVDAKLERHTTQALEAIDNLFAIYGVKDLSAKVAGIAAKRDKKRLLLSIRKLVSRRHNIVHEGDLNRLGKPVQADPDEFARRIKSLILFVSKADEFLHKELVM